MDKMKAAMGNRGMTGIKSILIPVWISASIVMGAAPAIAADGGHSKAMPSPSPDARAMKIFADYCEIVPQRDLRGAALDPSLTAKQADRFRVDSYNGTEKKLAAMRRKLMKLDHGAVEKTLHKQMETQDPDDTDNLMCVMEIVARSLPKEYDDYAKLIKPGVDQSGFVNYFRDSFLGKDGALHEPYGSTLP